jgi:L-aminopeptidase/D-esterase-like protein
VHAIVLTGGSAFGLSTADGAMAWLEERRTGFAAGRAIVPIVPAAVIFDGAAATATNRPGRDAGYAACDAARAGVVERGRIGAGAGATAGKWAGIEHLVATGCGAAVAQAGDASVFAFAVANPAGDIVGDDGRVLAGTRNPNPSFALPPTPEGVINTVLAVVACEASLTKGEVAFLAARGSDGIGRAVRPAHTRYDGDAVFALAARPPGGGSPRLDVLGMLATEAVAAAVRDAGRQA